MSDPFRAAPDPIATPASRPARSSVMLSATVERGGGQATTHRVRDVSPGGIRIDNAGGLDAGMAVSVTVGAARTVESRVIWARSGFAGLAFAAPIDLAAVRKTVGPVLSAARTDGPRQAPTAGWIGDLRDAYVR